ncbi:hypothetical protein ABAC460_08940 [Asticcacaulis sp. AC460]|uniref:hypothetical protein n=1 Tax=Asticcacaulis sp. AC460 TaxID=1282360 RepID=UPI0003C40D93|nr:hypothetical protein [Asticcacaulis sp. AC460]ESQ90603.1 hypothetical protein ABAC460_08940 [Asticcacaulis sp. AC460]
MNGKKLIALFVVVSSLGVCSCADLAYNEATAPMPVLAEQESPARGTGIDGMVYVPADKVIDNGERTGKRGSESWVCANPECTVAQRERSSPPPNAQDKPRQF